MQHTFHTYKFINHYYLFKGIINPRRLHFYSFWVTGFPFLPSTASKPIRFFDFYTREAVDEGNERDNAAVGSGRYNQFILMVFDRIHRLLLVEEVQDGMDIEWL